MISWDASRRIRDFDSGVWDVALRHCLEPDNRYFCEPVLRHWFTPLMCPELARYVRSDKDIVKHGLIGTEREILDAWPSFLRLIGLPHDPKFAMTCPGTRIALELAVKFNHVALGGSFFAEKHLSSGSLESPIPIAIMVNPRMWLMCAKGRENSDEILWLRDTLHASAKKFLERVKGFAFFDFDGSPVTIRF